MRTVLVISLTFLLLVTLCSCQHDDPTAPASSSGIATLSSGFSPELVAQQAVALTPWPIDEATGIELVLDGASVDSPSLAYNVTREVLVDDIVHTSFDVRVGPGTYDVIRLHRVAREDAQGRPLRTRDNVFLLHGDGVGFVKFIFGTVTPVLPPEQSVAVYLAQNGIDVWGMDQNWALVPAGLSDQSFAADWGMQNQVDNLRAGIATARELRHLTGGGPNKMNVLGYSSGAYTVYSLANEETQRPPAFRQMAGMVIAEGAFKLDPVQFEYDIWVNCDYYAYLQDELQNGVYDAGFGAYFQATGQLADDDPNGDSPFAPGITNLQFALLAGAAPNPDSGVSPWYHFFAGEFENDFPVDFTFSQLEAVLDFLQVASPFEASKFVMDYSAIMCDEIDVPWDDHLNEIRIPTLQLGAAGGFGDSGLYTLNLLGSTDVSVDMTSIIQPNEVDFAHIDLWVADNAPELVWPKLLEWLTDHTPSAGGPVRWTPAAAAF